ncbi:hypothetical protein D3C75_1025670 [compost metagenome]
MNNPQTGLIRKRLEQLGQIIQPVQLHRFLLHLLHHVRMGAIRVTAVCPICIFPNLIKIQVLHSRPVLLVIQFLAFLG